MKGRLRTPGPPKQHDDEKDADAGGYQNPRAYLFALEARVNVKDVTQRRGGEHRSDEETN